MDVPSHAEVVEQIDSFLARHHMAPSRLGRDAIGEPQFVSSVRGGRTPGLPTLRKLSAFMRAQDEKLEGAIATVSIASGTPPHRLNAEAK